MYPFAGLPENLTLFCTILRDEHRFRIGARELQDAARALEVVPLADERMVRDALRPILSSTRDDVRAFDRAFTDFFFPGPKGVPQERMAPIERGPGGEQRRSDQRTRRRPVPTAAVDEDDAAEPGRSEPVPLDVGDDAGEEAGAVARATYSPLEGEASESPDVTRADAPWQEAARLLVRRLHVGLSRRWRPARRGQRFDLRRTLRASLQTGGEPLAPRWLRRPRRAPRFVVLVDGSRSMSAYARTALTLAVATAGASPRVEVFTFSTALRRVTPDIRLAAAGRALRLERLETAWGGGTDIGASLRAFLHTSGERLVRRDTVVIIVSDGLDVGEPSVLRDAMRELHRRSAGIVWLNPLLETPGYEPTASGMRAARPYVGTFASVSDAAGFARLARVVRVRG